MTGGVLLGAAYDVDPAAMAVFLALFAFVTVLGFIAAAWRPGNLDRLDEWGIAGRRFGPSVTWFLLGGSIFTAYTYISVPELVSDKGGLGFFALAYTIIVFPLFLVLAPRLWSVCHRHGYLTAGDFVRGRYGSRPLALVVACTGILATMPYIALQLVGIRTVLKVMGVSGDTWPLVIAFALVAAYTYHSGVRAPALIAIVKDILIFVTVAVVVFVAARRLDGFDGLFGTAGTELPPPPDDSSGGLLIDGADQVKFATLALGSALALPLYPHVLTGVLSARSADVTRRAMVAMPVFSIVLGLIGLLGYAAIAVGIDPSRPELLPELVLELIPGWFSGFAFAAIVIGALVPSAIMSIGVANLFTRNIYTEYIRPEATDAQECQMARLASLVVKAGALVFVVAWPDVDTIKFQLLGGVWILQTLPALVIGLYSRWLHSIGLIAGWVAGMVVGTAMAADDPKQLTYELRIFGFELSAYEGLYALVLNLVVAVTVTVLVRRTGRADHSDETCPADYEETTGSDRGAPRPLPSG